MANAARVHAVEQGAAASDYTLVAFGGAAPLHVGRLAEKLSIDRYVVPTAAGVGSAIGFLQAPVAYDVVRSRTMRLSNLDFDVINGILVDMHTEALAVVEAGAKGGEALTESRGAYMRYVGQGHEILVSVPSRSLGPEDQKLLQAAFDAEYQALYGRVIPDGEVEVLTWTLSLSTQATNPAPVANITHDQQPRPLDMRPVFDPHEGADVELPLFWREELAPGMRVEGPAIVAEDETSTLIIAGFTAHIASNGNIVAERISGETQ